jgi:hypothetical protein
MASRIFEQFLIDYQPVLTQVEDYLDEVIEKTNSTYRQAYMPWKDALHELISGVSLISKEIPLPNKETFMQALRMFSFESTITFLRDLCNICQLRLKNGWRKEFKEHINELLCSFSPSVQDYQI